MFELNETVLPPIWSVIRRELTAGPKQNREDLINRLTPTGLIRRADERGVSRHVRPTIAALEEFQFIEADADGKLSLTNPALDEASFRAAVVRRMLAPDGENIDIWAVRPGGQQLEYDAALAMAWLHLQGLERPVGNWQNAAPVLDEQLGVDRRLLRSDVTFNALDRLARWGGIGAGTTSATIGQQLIPDATELIQTLLPELLPEPVITAEEFVLAAGRLLPWLPNGPIGVAVANEMTRCPDPAVANGDVSQSLSLALIRLEAEAKIELETGDDPNGRALLRFPDGDTLGVARVIRR